MAQDTLGVVLRRIRRARGFSLEKLSQISGVAFGYIGDVERGAVKSPGVDNLKKLCDALGITLDALVKEAESGVPRIAVEAAPSPPTGDQAASPDCPPWAQDLIASVRRQEKALEEQTIALAGLAAAINANTTAIQQLEQDEPEGRAHGSSRCEHGGTSPFGRGDETGAGPHEASA